MPTGNEVEVTLCLTDGTKLTRIEDLADITTFLEQHEEFVKIVRCKDCKYRSSDKDKPYCDRINPYRSFYVGDNDFCSWGEKNDSWQGKYCVDCALSSNCQGAGLEKPACKSFEPRVRYVNCEDKNGR